MDNIYESKIIIMKMYKATINITYVNAKGEKNKRISNKYMKCKSIEIATKEWANIYKLDNIIKIEEC